MDQNNLKQIIVDRLKIGSLSEEAQDKIIAKLEANITNQVIIDVMDRLSPEDREAFAAAEPDAEVLSNFLTEKIPDLDWLIEKAATETVDKIAQ